MDLGLLCNMLDDMALASFCICKEIDGLHKNDARRQFLQVLSNSLVLANVEERTKNQRAMGQFTTRLAVESYFGRKIDISTNAIAAHASGADTLASKRDCRLCLQDTDKVRRKTRFFLPKMLQSGMPAAFKNCIHLFFLHIGNLITIK